MLKIRDEQMKVFEQTALRNLENEDAAFTSTQGREISIDSTLKIRDEQMKIFEEIAFRSYEDEMLLHLSEYTPPLYKAVGEDQMRKVIRFGVDRAEKHGLTLRGPVRLYLEMMLLFGSHFDTDPQYPWAAKIICQGHIPEMQRAEQLYESTLDYRKKVNGVEDVPTLRALKDISVFARQPIHLTDENLENDILEEMRKIYPEKTTYIGEDGLRALIHEGIDKAHEYNLMAVRENVLILILMFTFGHGCTKDLLYPWIARTLERDLDVRAKLLESKALTWLDKVLAYYNGEQQT
jgi:hypothetical protein